MTRLRYLTAGESHGPALVGILEGLPAGLPVEAADIDRDLARRQRGYGRGGRMTIEKDAAEILSGVRFGETLGSPVALLIRNRDFANWGARMSIAPAPPDPKPVTVPRPGHADLAGGLKYADTGDLRDVLERASARETAIRVALGALARTFLRDLGIQVGSYVRSIGAANAAPAEEAAPELCRENAEELGLLADRTETRALDEASSQRLAAEIDAARARRDTVGGVVEVVATGVPVGLGSHVHWDRKLDGRLARALMSIPAIKAVEIGDGWANARRRGSEVHDPIVRDRVGLGRTSNRAGGLEGGVTNGQPLVLRAAMKPIATVPAALPSVDLRTLAATPAHVERSDTCAVPAAGVIAEATVALTLADAVLEALGGDTMAGLRLPFARLRVAARTSVGHVYLVGPMGSGKTAVGVVLAASLSLPFVDLDAAIEGAAGKPIREIFASQGEAAFRAAEAKTLAEVADGAPSVVAVGGGAVQTEAAWSAVRATGVSVWLRADPEELARRLAASGELEKRPLLTGTNPVDRLRELDRLRRRWYARADAQVDTVRQSPESVAAGIRAFLRTVEGPFASTARASGGSQVEAVPDSEGET